MGALAQVPPAATPGGVFPRVSPAVEPAKRSDELFDIPRVTERPHGVDAGSRIFVKRFRLTDAQDRPARALRVADVTSLLESARVAQPAQGFSIGEIQEVAGRVATYYRERGYILAQAILPEQDVVDGVVTVQVIEGRLSEVEVEGNKHYASKMLVRPFGSLLGEPVEQDAIESALLTLTSYPGITASGVLGAGREVGTSRLTLRVRSEDRVRIDTAVDNFGAQFAGEYRGQVTLTFNNPLGRADRLQLVGLYALDSSNHDTHGVYGGLDYEIPLFSPRDSLRLLHLTNAYNAGANEARLRSLDTQGDTQVDEIGYRHDFAHTRLGSASVGIAFNVKSSQFSVPPAVIYDDKLTTARLDAQWERLDTRMHGSNRIALSYTHGFKDILGDYDLSMSGGASRLGASGEFEKVSLRLQRVQRLARNASLLLRVDGQYSDDPLVSLEQFSLGGPDSVRAYSVSEVLAEKGGIASLELMLGAPGFASRPAFGNLTWGQVLQLSLFGDYAKGRLNPPLLSSQEKSFELSGVGASPQLSVPGHVFARVDVATPLSNRSANNDRDPQYYVRFGASF